MGRQVLQQKGQGLVDRRSIDGVVVVQHQEEAIWQGRKVVEHGRQDRLGWRRLRGLERGQRALSHGRGDRLQRGDQISQETGWVAVPFVQRQPGGWQAAGGCPFAGQRSLAKPGGGGDQGQFTGQSCVQLLEQAQARDSLGPGWGLVYLGG